MYLSKVELEDKMCPLGCPRSDERVLIGHDRLHNLPGDFTVVKCQKCGLMRTNPRPTPETIKYYYPEDYGPYINTRITPESSKLNTQRPFWKRQLRKIIYPETLPQIPLGRLLEIGCASGAYIYKMAQQGWEVEGIEPDEKSAENARQRGFPVHTSSIETANIDSEPFSLIIGWMVFEHLHEPNQVLQKLASWADSNAWLVLSVPNAGSMEFKMFKDRWYALQLPNHLYHYTQKTIIPVLAQGGWRIVRVMHQRNLTNLVVSLGYTLQDQGLSPNIAKALLRYPQYSGRIHRFIFPTALLLSLFGQTGRMTIWAKKKL